MFYVTQYFLYKHITYFDFYNISYMESGKISIKSWRALVCRYLFHNICLKRLNVIIQVMKTEGIPSRESLFSAKQVVHLVSSVVGRNIFSSDSIFFCYLRRIHRPVLRVFTF